MCEHLKSAPAEVWVADRWECSTDGLRGCERSLQAKTMTLNPLLDSISGHKLNPNSLFVVGPVVNLGLIRAGTTGI